MSRGRATPWLTASLILLSACGPSPRDEILLSTSDDGFWVRRADQHPEPALRAVAAATGLITSAWLDEWRADWVFDLFDPDGGYRGTVTLPFQFTPMAVTASSVVGSITDALDVEYVVRFEVMGLADESTR